MLKLWYLLSLSDITATECVCELILLCYIAITKKCWPAGNVPLKTVHPRIIKSISFKRYGGTDKVVTLQCNDYYFMYL